MEVVAKSFGKMCKSLGRGLDSMGAKMEGRLAVKEECICFSLYVIIVVCPCCCAQSALNRTPDISKASFIAPTASVSGNVTMGANSSVWYGSTIRGCFIYYLMIYR